MWEDLGHLRFSSDRTYFPRFPGFLGCIGYFRGVWVSVLSENWVGCFKWLWVKSV